MNLQHRSYTKELLDGDDIPFEDIRKNMQELDFINTWLGGHAITIKGLQILLQKRNTISVCEIGCGGGDNLSAIRKWCKKKNIKAKCTGIDIKEECIAFATQRNRTADYNWIASDYKEVKFAQKPDIIFSSLFCHHFTEEELDFQLKWMQANSTVGFFINDLHRQKTAYYSIKILTQLFSSSYLVKNDAPLSVRRGFIKKEWEKIFTIAGISAYNIQWKWAFRHLIIYRHHA